MTSLFNGGGKELTFQAIKQTIVSAPILAHPNTHKPFIVETDTSNIAAEAALLKEGNNSLEHPVAFLSKKMQLAETNYPIYDKELLSIVEALGEWSHHLMFTCYPFTIWTDHKALEDYKSLRRVNQQQACWHLDLTMFDFMIQYKAGSLKHLPDMLSQDPSLTFEAQELDELNATTILFPNLFAMILVSHYSLLNRIRKPYSKLSFGKWLLAELKEG